MGENLLVVLFVIAPSSQELEPPVNPARFSFSRLKQFHRVATRFEKTARNYLAMVTFAATILWLR
jgi:transposase